MARILLRSPQSDTSVPAQTVRCFGPNNFARVPRRAESHSESENTYQPRNSDSLHHHLCSREGLGRDRPEQSISQQQLQLAAEQKRIQPEGNGTGPVPFCRPRTSTSSVESPISEDSKETNPIAPLLHPKEIGRVAARIAELPRRPTLSASA